MYLASLPDMGRVPLRTLKKNQDSERKVKQNLVMEQKEKKAKARLRTKDRVSNQ